MDIKNIVDRRNEVLSVEEQSFVVEQYIKDIKGVDVTVNLRNKMDIIPQGFQNTYYQQQVQRLNLAFEDAVKHYIKK